MNDIRYKDYIITQVCGSGDIYSVWICKITDEKKELVKPLRHTISLGPTRRVALEQMLKEYVEEVESE